jgi:hypothetical protein
MAMPPLKPEPKWEDVSEGTVTGPVVGLLETREKTQRMSTQSGMLYRTILFGKDGHVSVSLAFAPPRP